NAEKVLHFGRSGNDSGVSFLYIPCLAWKLVAIALILDSCLGYSAYNNKRSAHCLTSSDFTQASLSFITSRQAAPSQPQLPEVPAKATSQLSSLTTDAQHHSLNSIHRPQTCKRRLRRSLVTFPDKKKKLLH